MQDRVDSSHESTNDEREILDRFEGDELRSIPEAEREMELTRRMARSTLNKPRRVDP